MQQAFDEGRHPVGTWVQIDSPEICEIAAAAGFDFVIIDMEHGSFGLSQVVGMIRAVEGRSSAPVVRVPVNERSIIGRVLDAGAASVLVPGIKSREDAERAIAATRFEPEGTRGACPSSRYAEHGLGNWPDAEAHVHSSVGVWLLIEHPRAVEDIDAIVALGPDALVLGPFDLSMAMGLKGDHRHPDVRAAFTRVVAAANAAGVDTVAVTIENEPDRSARVFEEWMSLGCNMGTALIDRLSLGAAFTRVVSATRSVR